MNAPAPSTESNAVHLLLVFGAMLQLGQILTFREIMAITHGTELVFGAVFGAWLLWAALGAALGGYQRTPAGQLPRAWLMLTSLLAGPVLVGQLLLIRFVPWMPNAAAGQMLDWPRALLLAGTAPGPLAFLGGLHFALTLRAWPTARLGCLYRAESWGAVLGGLLTTFVLVEFAPPLCLSLGAGLVLALASGFLLRRHMPRAFVLRALGVLVVLSLAVGACLPTDRWVEAAYWQRLLPGYALEATRETRHGRMSILQGAGQTAVFHNSALLSTVEHDTDQDQHTARLIGCQHPAPQRALLLGGALSNLPPHLLAHGLQRLDVVELDPAVLALAQTLRPALTQDARLKLHASDGRAWIKHVQPHTYDLIVIHIPEPDNAATNRFCTRSFFQEVRRALQPDGVVCLFLPAHGASPEYTHTALARRTASVLASLQAAFAYTRAAPIAGHLLVASDAPQITLRPETLAQRLATRPLAQPYTEILVAGQPVREPLTSDALPAYFEAQFGGVLAEQASLMQDTANQPLLEAWERTIRRTAAERNEDMRPVTMLYSLALWHELAQPGLGQDARAAEDWAARLTHLRSGAAALAPLTVICLAALLALLGRRGAAGAHRLILFLCAAATGAFAMAIEVTLLFLVQNLCGYVYSEVGLLIALFMAGLALGAWCTDRHVRRPIRALLGLLLCMMGLCLATPWLAEQLAGSLIWARAGIALLILVAGMADGATFPLLRVCVPHARTSGIGASLYASDLLGASLASVCVSVVLIPALGVSTALQLVALLLAAPVLGLVRRPVPKP